MKLEPIGFAVQKMWAQKPKSQGDASLGLRWGLVRRAALGGRSGAVWGSKESEVVLSICVEGPRRVLEWPAFSCTRAGVAIPVNLLEGASVALLCCCDSARAGSCGSASITSVMPLAKEAAFLNYPQSLTPGWQ